MPDSLNRRIRSFYVPPTITKSYCFVFSWSSDVRTAPSALKGQSATTLRRKVRNVVLEDRGAIANEKEDEGRGRGCEKEDSHDVVPFKTLHRSPDVEAKATRARLRVATRTY